MFVGVLNASSYSPSPDTVSVGETVAWHNADNMAHTATSDVTGATGFGTRILIEVARQFRPTR